MKRIFALLLITAFSLPALANEPDSVYLFSYATEKNNNHNGLQFAWSTDKTNWKTIGNDYGFLRCDYGRWGAEKRMITPYLLQGPDGVWQCVWSLNERENKLAHAASKDLLHWGRQSYPLFEKGENCMIPVIAYDKAAARFVVAYKDKRGEKYVLHTNNFKTYSYNDAASYQQADMRTTVMLPGGEATGQVHRVAWELVDKLLKAYDLQQYKNSLNYQRAAQDVQRFEGLAPVIAKITINAAKPKRISDILMGVFFEDLNYAADGGLYAELVQNRDFEYALSDKEGHDTGWHSTHSWTLKGANASFVIDSAAPVHENNKHYAVLTTTATGASLQNSGFDGIAVKKGEAYNFSVIAKNAGSKAGRLKVRLAGSAGNVLAETVIKVDSKSWKKISAVLAAANDASDAHLELVPQAEGKLMLDMVSLFPQKTFRGRFNGLRNDLAETIAGIHPRFVRFPGGCVAHGDGLENIYRWKNTIGPLESRKPQPNLWGYHQSAGLGYFEYFQFCEDIGAVPVPVIAAGVPCQNSGNGGQQGGIPLQEMDAYIQDIFDLVEYANGDASSRWGKLRAQAGHPAPFNLKYIGIGNEDLISDVFEERFTMIFNAMKQKHPEITVIGTVGPFYEGTDYEQGWDIAAKLGVEKVDEHYYQPPGWFIYNQDFYDKYDRSKSKVYLGEYAAHLPGRPNNIETALSEALYLTAVERNGDIVSMASYAPLLAKEGHTQWNPDLIYFNNTQVKPTVGYYVQQLYGLNSGDEYLPGSITVNNNQDAVKNRVAYSSVRDSKTGDLIIKLVNMLPVTVSTSLQLDGFTTQPQQVTKTVLQGNPADKDAKPVSSASSFAEVQSPQLPPYSFVVYRVAVK
ncbi:alpha-L-arabinofuranosidase C-terminal domain-containing protein [Foetidibacter luteolus]|uniref:alpha-L-arabinofuranosidase C-terminal domain-containing protein n=1 Tax=Foetidibacter luteolus TaxID=2608880 RepID=UPI00129B9EB3|nr:alpha-L-arabinofuranosidase C-terminal domain-containing protein [Foetidibacter luteolus]